jgi:hypothetical protein
MESYCDFDFFQRNAVFQGQIALGFYPIEFLSHTNLRGETAGHLTGGFRFK